MFYPTPLTTLAARGDKLKPAPEIRGKRRGSIGSIFVRVDRRSVCLRLAFLDSRSDPFIGFLGPRWLAGKASPYHALKTSTRRSADKRGRR